MEQDSCDGKVVGTGSLTYFLEGILGPPALPQEVSGDILGPTDVYRSTIRMTSVHC